MLFDFLAGYSGESIDELIGYEGRYRIDSIVLAIEQAVAQKSVFTLLSAEERIVLAVEALEREVNNGGYQLFFLNTSEYVPIVVQALRAIGCPRCADITAGRRTQGCGPRSLGRA